MEEFRLPYDGKAGITGYKKWDFKDHKQVKEPVIEGHDLPTLGAEFISRDAKRRMEFVADPDKLRAVKCDKTNIEPKVLEKAHVQSHMNGYKNEVSTYKPHSENIFPSSKFVKTIKFGEKENQTNFDNFKEINDEARRWKYGYKKIPGQDGGSSQVLQGDPKTQIYRKLRKGSENLYGYGYSSGLQQFEEKYK